MGNENLGQRFKSVLNGVTLQRFLVHHQLGKQYLDDLETHIFPALHAMARVVEQRPRPPVVGITGSQGSGKTTLSTIIAALLEEAIGLRCIVLSLDDFYLPKQARKEIGDTIHPLLTTRGVPGTHDLVVLQSVLDHLTGSSDAAPIAVPRFDKSIDDRIPEADWPTVSGNTDIVLLEGWCIGCPPQSPLNLRTPVNELESEYDKDGTWREYVNRQLMNEYRTFFARFDVLLMLAAPSFEVVFDWRRKQEQRMQITQPRSSRMDDQALSHFIQHYERLTRHMIAELVDEVDYLVRLDVDQRMIGSEQRMVES